MRQLYVVPRRRLVIAVWLTVLALPILVIDNIPRTEARAAPVRTELIRAAPDFTAPSSTTTVVESTTVTEAPTAEETPTTRAATKKPVTVATAAPKATTTTTTTAPPNRQDGGASWYDYRPGECAHQTLPKGTVVTIRSLETGATTTCTVTDRGPYEAGRIIDLDRDTFAQLADPGRGLIQVEITW